MTAVSVYDQRWAPSGGAGLVLDFSAATHVGTVRTLNEDAFLAGPPLFVVADGMGGHERGEVASGLVIEAFSSLVGRDALAPVDLESAVRHCREAIDALSPTADPPGSTVLVAAYTVESGVGYWLVGHAGDSRAYLWRGGSLERLTRDHSIVQGLLDAGLIDAEQARVHPERNVITRAVGAHVDAHLDFALVPVESGSRLLLCSDGLTGELSDRSLAVLLADATDSHGAVDALLQAAIDAGGRDNVTVLVVDVLGEAVVDDTRGRRPTDLVEDTIPGARSRR